MSTGCATRSPHISSGPRCLPKTSDPSQLPLPIDLSLRPNRALEFATSDSVFAGEHSMIGDSQYSEDDGMNLAGQPSATVVTVVPSIGRFEEGTSRSFEENQFSILESEVKDELSNEENEEIENRFFEENFEENERNLEEVFEESLEENQKQKEENLEERKVWRRKLGGRLSHGQLDPGRTSLPRSRCLRRQNSRGSKSQQVWRDSK
jgi:hypothetical protein